MGVDRANIVQNSILFIFFKSTDPKLVTVQYLLLFCRPDLVDFSSLKPTERKTNLENAFSVAERDLGVDRLLDPEGRHKKQNGCHRVSQSDCDDNLKYFIHVSLVHTLGYI